VEDSARATGSTLAIEGLGLGVVLGRGNGAANAFKLFPAILLEGVGVSLALGGVGAMEFFLHGRSSIGEETIVTFWMEGDRVADTGTPGVLGVGEEEIGVIPPK